MQATGWREQWAAAVHNPEDLVRFVDAVGCCAGLEHYPEFPHIAPVFGEIDPSAPDPWFWKDDLHIAKRLYYTRVFGGNPGYLSNALLPSLIATNGAVVDELLVTGNLSPETQQVYRVIEEYGPIPVRKLKQQLTPDAKRSANTILHFLERRFIITKTDITGRGRGMYSYVWDLTERWMPEMLEAADRLGRRTARAIIREHLAAFGIMPDSSFYRKVLGWGE